MLFAVHSFFNELHVKKFDCSSFQIKSAHIWLGNQIYSNVHAENMTNEVVVEKGNQVAKTVKFCVMLEDP